MPQDKPLYTLYKGLRANNYDVPDNYASFERTLTEAGEGGAKSRHTLYRALKSQNYDVPDTYERFYNTLFDVVNKTTSRAKPAPSSPSRPRPSAHAAPAGQRQRAIAGVKNTAGKILGITQQMAHQVESARPVPRKPKTPAKPLTAAQKQQMIAGAQAAVDNVAAGNSRVANQIAFANANLGLQANPARLGQNGRVAVRGADGKVRKPQPAPIGMDLADTYVTESGNEYSDRSAADREQNALDAIRYNREHRREYLEAQKRRIEQEMNQRGKELDAEALDFSWRDMPRGSGGAVHTYNSSTANGRFADTRYMALSAQLSQVNDALGVLDEAEHGKASDAWINNSSNWFERKGKQLLGFGAGAWRGLAHAVGRVNTWDLGMTDLTTNAAMYNAAINHDKGKATKEERDLLDLAAYAKGVRAENEKYIGYGYEAGEVTGESLPFMIEMMMNPASGLGKTAANQIMRVAVKKYGKEAVRRATKKYLAAKIGTRILGDVAGSAIMAGTSGQGRVHADALNRLTGDVKFKEDENGQIVYDGRKGAEDNVVDAYLKAFGAQTIENHSEMLGEYFAPLLGRAASVTRKGMERIGLGSVNRFIDDVGATNAARMLKDFEGRAKWNGIIGEYAEEVLGNVENALVVGDMTLDTNEQTGVFNKDQNIRTFLGVGLMGGFLSGVKTASYRGPKRQALNDMAAAGKAVDEAAAGNDKMREKWADWRIKLLVGSEEEKVSTLREVMDDEQLPMGFRMGVLNFSKAAQKYEGLVRAQKSKKEEGAQDAVDESYDESYDNGYDTTDPSAMHEAKVQLDAAREKLTKKLNGASTPEEANKIIDDPLEYIHAQRAAGASVEDLQEVVDYANAKSAFDGMLQRVRDDIDGRVDESDSMVDSRVNKDTGMITRATMKVGDRQVYVVDGIVAMHEDGSMVDVNNSSESILVRDAQTGKLEWASPHDILSVDEGVKPEEEKAAAAEAIRQEVAGTAAAQIDGVADGATAETQGPAAQSQPATEATAANEAPVATAEAHESGPAYALNDEITLYNEKGEPVHGVVNAEENEDGLIEVYTDRPINGNRINLYSREELDRMAGNSGIQSSETEAAEPTDAQVGSSTEAGAVEPAVALTENEQPMVEPQPAAEEQPQVEAQPSEEVRPSALERVPKDEQGQPVYEMAEPGTAWDAIVEQTGGDEQMAQTVAESMVADKKAALKKAEKAKARQGGTIAEKIAAEQERKAAIEQAKAELAHWQNIAMMQQQRRSEAERAKEEAARKAAEEKAAEEARLKAEHEEAERKEREALDGVPDWTEDTAQNARARGFRRSNGGKYDRQGPVAALQGKEVEVKFADQVKQKARVAVMEAGALQPSHHNGQPNVLHFIPEAQPKKRTDEASVSSSENMARNINPEEITSSVTAYTGAPTVNSRGEVIQGNNRSAALKTMWQSHAEQAEKYKQYLMEHAEEFGLNAEDIARMENPVLVNMADVDDEKAIELGQYDVKDTESGGTERIKPKNAVMKMGGDMKTFAARLLSSSDEEASFSQLVDANGVDVLKWMSQKGFITPTQYKSAFDSKGNLTAEAANDLKGIMYQSIFQNGSERLEEMFNTLPAKAQRALLATAYRDFDSPESERMVPEIQQSIMAYHALMLDDAFANAKTMKEAQTAILMWQRQYQFDDATGESYLPTNKFSNFALQLAAMYKVQTQRLIQGTFNQMYDLIQGTQEADLFNQDTLDNTPRSLAEAIKEVLNIDYNGQQGSNVLGGRDATGQPGRQGSSGAAEADGRGEEGERPAEREGGAEAADDNSSKKESQAVQESIGLGHDGRGRVDGGSLQRQGDLAEAEEIKLSDEIDENGRQFVLTSEGELAFGEIGEDTGLTTAPILLSEGMITNPATNDGYGLAHIEARHGDQIRKAGYKSVVDFIETVAKNYDVIKEGNLRDGHQTYRLQLTDKHNNTLMIELSGDGTYWNINTAGIFKTSYGKKNKEVYSRHTTAKQPVEAAETSQDAEQGDTQTSSSMNVPTSSNGKVTYNQSPLQENGDKSLGGEEKTPLSAKIDEASADVNTEPTEAQKEAGNYKKGHVQVGTFDITIEQPQGSVRKGTDADGKQWESKMHNTYGYIRGTIGVDGDHIDAFLSNDIDGWNGRKVFVVDQYNPDGSFDEHKVMLGFNDADEAKSDYLANYEDGWENGRRIDVTAVNLEDFEKWMGSSKRKTKPFSEYSSVKKEEGGNSFDDFVRDSGGEVIPNGVSRSKIINFAERILEKYTSHTERYDSYNAMRTDVENMPAHKLFKSESDWFSVKNGNFIAVNDTQAKACYELVAHKDAQGHLISVSVIKYHSFDHTQQELSSDGKGTEKDSSGQENGGKTFKITPKEYITKRGKKLEMQLVTFEGELSKEQMSAAKKLAKDTKGWWSKEDGGFLMRDIESAQKLAESVLGDTEAVADAQPLSLIDMKEAAGDLDPRYRKGLDGDYDKWKKRQDYLDEVERKDKAAVAEGREPYYIALNDSYGQRDGSFVKVWLKPEEVETIDGEKKFAGKHLWTEKQAWRSEEGFSVVRTEYNGDAILKEKAEAEKKAQPSKTDEAPKSEPKDSGNKLVTDERYAELKKLMRKKLGQLNVGIDPEVLAIGTEMAVYHIEKGARKFTEYAKAMIKDMGDAIRPYLKAFYNGARDLPEVEANGWVEELTPYNEVRTIDIANFDKPTVDAMATAEMVIKEQEAEQQKDEAIKKITDERNANRTIDEKSFRPATEEDIEKRGVVYYEGKPAHVAMVMHSGEQVGAAQFSKPHIDRIYLTNGKDCKLEDLMVEDKDGAKSSVEELKPVGKGTGKSQKSQKKKTNKKFKPEQQVGDLFAGMLDKSSENGLQRNDGAVRTERVPADSSGQQQGLRGSEEGPRKGTEQEGGRSDGSRGGQSTGEDRPVPAGLHGLIKPKNRRNNHSERGADHAPTSVNGRIEANIKAIELAHELLESGEAATPEQMSVLRQFSGWGGLGSAFGDGGHDWKQRERNKKICELLGEEAYEQAVMSANSAYYTPAYVVDTLWDIAKQLGFKGGKILEGSAGIGNILGQMPTTVSERSDIHAIEIDGTSGGILSLLYPDAKVEIQGFEQTRIPNGSVDLAITNVPFVTGLRVNDTTGDSDLSKKFHNIHDFCIAKNVRKLREGGLGIFISSNGTLDNSKSLRDWVVNEGGSDFIGAFRMHNKTFGGTTVTSDIIVVRKRVNGQKSSQAIDVSSISGERTAEYEEPGARKAKQLSMDYNKYFIEHPDHMAGEMRFAFEEGDTFRPTSKGLYPVSGKDQSKMLADFVKSFTEEDNSSAATTDQHTSLVLDASADGKKLGEMYMKDGKIVLANIGGYYPLELNDKKIKGHTKQECFTAYAAIKSALADVMQYQTDNEGDTGLKPLIAKLNKAYDDFVNTYGHFNKNNQLAWLRNDVDYPNVFSLEIYKEQGDGKGGVVKTYDKADVMKGRVVEKENEPHPENVKDGVVVSMFKNGRIDVPYIAGQLGKSEAEVKREIIESGLGFEDPTTRQMEVSYQYLSGNVREKLKQAEANNENGEYSKNIKALQEVVPMNIPAHLIDFTLGSSWLDPKLYDEYVKERTGIDVHFTAAGGTWFMKAPTYGLNVEKNRAMGIVSEMLKRTVMGHELIGAAIQNKSVVVSRTEKHYDGTTETITDREATAACAAKIDEIRQDFKDWMRGKMQSDSDLSERMEQEYNDRFNNYVPMSIPDDFVPEYFEGATRKFKMRPHQGKAIVRGTMQPLLLAHEVGTGKTFTLISTAMEMRRLGTARKPMIVVQNATVGQFAASAKELYPNVKILTLEDNDRNAEGRKNFYAKIKYNDWDMIVVPQSTFEFIPDSDERQMQFVQDKIDEKMLVLEQMRKADTSGRDPITRRAEKELADLQAEMAALSDDISKKRTANDEKKKAVAKQNAAVKAQEMLDRRTDDVENFDDMGIDALLIDEAHEYKHLGFATAMQRGVKGVDPSYSKKSQGVYLKTQAILEKNNGRNVIFATGTPISNTAAEIWTFMRYLMPKDTMKEYGIYYFDDFVRNFGNIQQMPEFNTSGKFKEVNRFAGYVNLPELVRIWSGVADTVLTKDQTELVEKIPEMEGGKAQDIYLPQTRALRSVMKYVRSELHRFDQMSGKEKKENSSIPLTMYGIAQGAAVDARLVEMDAEDDPRSKTNEAVRQTLRSLKETDDYKGTVAIFADHYQNKRSGFNLYEDIKKKLVQQGVPESEVIVMKPGMTIKKKLEIFDKVNRGEVRVILGSTATLGTGVNIQERLHTLIHLDAPNRPMDYTQRNGRILRQGNLHKQWGKPVRVLRFGVEDSLDVTAYQRLKTKGAIADSVMEGDRLMQDSMNNRVLEEEEDVFGDTVAQLSGSEYALLKNNAEKNVRKYESRRKQWEADQTYIHNAKPKLEGQIKAAEQQADNANTHLLAVQKAFPDGKFTEITVGKQKYGSVDAMADFIKEHNKKIHDATKEMKEKPGNDARTNTLTLSLGGYNFVISTEFSRETVNNGGSLFAGIHRAMTYSCPELGLKNVPVKQSLLRNAIEDITENVITGKDFAERFDIAMSMAQHAKSELEQLKQREGKPFEFGKELEEAKRQFEEYSEAMKEEMAEKEKKYAEMDAGVEAASDISIDDEEKEDVLRDGDGVYSDEDLSLANDPSSKLLGESRYSATQRQAFAARTRKNMADHAKELAERLHLDNVEVVTDASTLSGRRQKAKGFYNKRTGKITIVVGNHLDLADVEQTVLHEAVAHYGLRKLFGEHFDTFLDNVFMHADLPIRQRITELARRHGWDFRTATEEYLANLAEDTDFEHLSSGFYGWWSYVKDAFLSMLHKIGFREYDGPSLSDNELRYILWRSYENLKEPGRFRSILGEAEDVTRQSKLKVGNYAERRETNESHAAEPLEAMPVKEDVNEINQKFNDELQKQLDGTLPSNHIYKMGRPGSVLLSTGVPDLPIQMSASRLKTKATSYGHDFDLGEVKDLVKALQNPLAVFSYGDKTKAQNIIVPLQKDGKNFIVGLSLNPTVGGRSLEINSIRNVFPKNNSEWLNWIAQGKALFLDKEKIQTLIDQQRTILADVTYLDLDSVAKVVKDFVNPKVSDENVADEDVLFRDGDDVEYEKAQARMMYERRVRSGLYQTQEAMLDSMLGLKEAMSSVLKAEKRYTGKIEDVAGFENAYLGENRLSSVNQAECEAFTRLLLNPLLKEISKLARDAAERADLTDYMMAKHGLERNRVMAERDAKKAFEEYQKEHPKGTKTLQDFIDANRKRDYAGLTALTDIPEVEDAEVEASVMVDEYERDHDTTELWDKVNAVTKATLQKSYESGFLNKATYDSIRSMYDNYIPLRGFDEKTSDEVYAYLSEKHSAFNAPIKTARGRKSKADDPLANMMTMAESAIMQGNRNVLVKQRFLNFVLNHPSDLVSVSDLWLRYDDVTGEWHPVNTGDVAGTERIEEDDSPSEVARKMEDFEQAMSQLAESDPDHFVRQKEHPSIPYRVVEGRDLRQHQVLVKRNGKDFILTINGNPRAAQALNGQTNPDNDVSGSIGKLLGVVGDVNRTLSMLYTTLQPDFVASNFLRDTLYANTMVWAKETPRYAARFNKNYALTKRVMHLLGKYRKGTLNMGNETEKMFYQFMKHGGETGFFRMADIDQHKEEVDRVLKGLNEKIPARKIRKYLTEWIGEIGRGIEMRARFAAFITSRQEGRSIDRSVWDAKEISVNFNKKGAGDKFLGENGQTRIGNAAASISGLGRGMFIFWNAALQGTFSNFGKYAARHPGKMAAVAATNFALGLLVSALASAGGGDDDDSYFDLPEHTRRQNLVIRGPGKTWVKIPLPMEYRAIYGMGELAGSTLLHNDPLDAGKLAGQVSQLLPVDLMEGFGGLWPSSVKPAWETYKNETWYGRPIWKETPFNTPAPQWTKAFDSTNPDLVNLASALNEASGGSDYKKGSIDLNPAAIEYLMKQYTGGFFTVVNQLRNLASASLGKKDFDWRYVPLANRMLMTGGDERNANQGLNEKFFNYMDIYKAKEFEVSAITNDMSLSFDQRAALIGEIATDADYIVLRRASAQYESLYEAYRIAKDRGDQVEQNRLGLKIKELKRSLVKEMEGDKTGSNNK